MPATSPKTPRSLVLAMLVISAASGAACGGKQGEAKSPETPAATSAGDTTTPASSAAPAPSSPTTTTAGLGATPEPGTKLPAAAPSTSAAAEPKKGPEPGRGVDDIKTIVVAHRDEARACYDEGLKRNPSIEGDLDIKFVIDPDGNPTNVDVDQSKSTIRDDGVAQCVIAIIKKLKFSKHSQGKETRTHYPFNFHPKQGQVGKGGAQPQK